MGDALTAVPDAVKVTDACTRPTRGSLIADRTAVDASTRLHLRDPHERRHAHASGVTRAEVLRAGTPKHISQRSDLMKVRQD